LSTKSKEQVERYGATVANYKKTFNDPIGQKVLWDLMQAHHFLRNTFTGDVNEALIREGERNVILRIMAILKYDPKKIQQMIEENNR
jgi:hypothetical protein